MQLRVCDKNLHEIQREVPVARRSCEDSPRHLLFLLQDMEMLPVEDDVPMMPRKMPVHSMSGFSVTCWFCGLLYPAGRRKSLAPWKCTVRTLQVSLGSPNHMQAFDQIVKMSIDRSTRPQFEHWLEQLNKLPGRRDHHWPTLVTVHGVEDGVEEVTLQCLKCTRSAPTPRKKAFLLASCKASVGLQAVLCPLSSQHKGGLKLATLNSGSILAKMDLIGKLDVDVIALQETCIGESQRAGVAKSCKAQNASVVFSSPCLTDQRPGKPGKVKLGTGLAVICFAPWVALSAAHLLAPPMHDVSHRILSVIAHSEVGQLMLHNIYMPLQNGQEREHIFDELQARIRQRPFMAHAVVGDWQEDFALTSLGQWLSCSGWLLHSHITAHQATNFPPKGELRRLDDVALSPNIAHKLAQACVVPVLGFSTHAMVWCELAFSSCPPKTGFRIRQAKSLREQTRIVNQASTRVNHWQDDIPLATSQQMHDEWCDRCNRWLGLDQDRVGVMKTSQDVLHNKLPERPRRRCCVRQNLVLKAKSWIEELVALSMKYEPSDLSLIPRVEQLKEAINRVPWSDWNVHSTPPVPDQWNHVMQWEAFSCWAREEWPQICTSLTLTAKHSLQAWKLQISDAALGSDMRFLSTWLSEGETISALRVEDDRLITCPIAMSQAIAEEWREFLTGHDASAPPMQDDTIRAMAAQVEQGRFSLPPLTGKMLRDVAQTRKNSSTGADMISSLYSKAMPLEAWDAFAKTMTQVEQSAVWPTQLLDVLMVMIPKKGEDSVPKAMKTRLIAITSHLYRTWATCRAQWLQRYWIPEAIAHQVFGGRKGLGTGDAIFYESTSWDLAASGQERWACAYFDASKCFDSYRFRDLVRVGERLGMPGPLLRAIESFYSHHRRHYLVKSWMTTIGCVKRGIPQGCPLSCVMAMAWAHTWIHVVQTFVTNAGLAVRLQQSAYLDDLSLACNDPPLLEKLVGVTSAHFDCWGVRLNLSKSAFVANARVCDSDRFGSLASLVREDSQLL